MEAKNADSVREFGQNRGIAFLDMEGFLGWTSGDTTQIVETTRRLRANGLSVIYTTAADITLDTVRTGLSKEMRVPMILNAGGYYIDTRKDEHFDLINIVDIAADYFQVLGNPEGSIDVPYRKL